MPGESAQLSSYANVACAWTQHGCKRASWALYSSRRMLCAAITQLGSCTHLRVDFARVHTAPLLVQLRQQHVLATIQPIGHRQVPLVHEPPDEPRVERRRPAELAVVRVCLREPCGDGRKVVALLEFADVPEPRILRDEIGASLQVTVCRLTE